MTPQQRELARHALGLDNPNARKRSYRNRYFTAKNTDAWHAWAKLCDVGFAYVEPDDRMDFFGLTRTGAEAVLEPGESLDLEDFPHD